MIRLLFGVIIGALVVYLLDSRQLDGRRDMLKERLNRETLSDARDRVHTAADRVREKVGEAKSHAQDGTNGVREHAEAVAGSDTDN